MYSNAMKPERLRGKPRNSDRSLQLGAKLFALTVRLIAWALVIVCGLPAGDAQPPVEAGSGSSYPYQTVRPSGLNQPYDAVCDPTQTANPLDCYTPSTQQGAQSGEVGPYSQPSTRTPREGRGLPLPSNASMNGLAPQDAFFREPRLAEQPNEFQRFVASLTGQTLPVFGQWVFERVPSTFSQAGQGAAPPDYRIGPGDELQVTVWGQVNFSTRLVVDQAGCVALPGVGPIGVAGLLPAEATKVLKAALGNIYRNFDLNLNFGGLRSIQVFVVGDAKKPGSYVVSGVTTLVNAVFASGGPTSLGSMRDIQLKRGDKVVSNFDLYQLLIEGDKSKDTVLQSGDVILIPAAGPRIALAGSVSMPGIYEIKGGTTLGEALRLAGGLSPVAAGREVLLDRFARSGALEAERISLADAGLLVPLQNGDVIRLLPAVPRFQNTVTLRGNVADPVRLPWHEGMRVSDLIPDKEALLTRDYWRERNRLRDDNQLALAVRPESAEGGHGSQTMSDARLGVETALPAVETSQGLLSLSPDSARAAHLDGTRSNYFDQVRSVRDDGSFAAATGQTSIGQRQFLPKNAVPPPAPDINWDYAVIERVDQETLATTDVPFDLGAAVLRHDAKADLPLKPGDVVTVFSVADFPTPLESHSKQIRLEGEVVRAGVYTVLPGENLRQVVKRAGGLTRNAYLYGAQFTREATRREQQKRLDDFLNQLENEVSQSAATLSGRVTSAEQANAAQTSLANQREMIERLRKTPVDGRIVLDLDPGSWGVDALPDLALENGDRFYVPSRPSTVNVIGTVFNQASFLYAEDLQLGDYLGKAGGPTRFADRNNMFVVRADGSVVSRNHRAAKQTRNFTSLRMHPGDTVVVPSYLNKTTVIRNLLDWSQAFSSLAFGAAALSVLKNQ